jgi:hypothetical protein
MQIDFTVHIWKEGNQFIAHAMPLDVASSGPTPEAARRALDETVKRFIDTAAEQHSLVDVLEEAGYARVAEQWQSPAWVGVELNRSSQRIVKVCRWNSTPRKKARRSSGYDVD